MEPQEGLSRENPEFHEQFAGEPVPDNFDDEEATDGELDSGSEPGEPQE
jgi:hypothetical protein